MISEFKILIVDDEVLIAEFLKDELKALGYNNIEMAHNHAQCMKQIEEFCPELVLLDIRMKNEREGIEIAEEINEKHKIPFIFITAHSDREILQQALNTKPAGYITKPIKQIDVYAAIRLVESNMEKSLENFIIVKDGYSEIKIMLDTILYVQSDDNYIHIYTTSKKHTVRNSLEWFRENTPSETFHRTHRSYIVNVDKITKSTARSVFIGTDEIPVSRGNQVKL
ncbi:MAG: hypothetical protein C0448_09125 [Sphingobacteriaceae bacterium]|nr:hypothetical protein [Sphingobacteriaceae bacterium]